MVYERYAERSILGMIMKLTSIRQCKSTVSVLLIRVLIPLQLSEV